MEINTKKQEKMSSKTRDGFRIEKLARSVNSLFSSLGFEVREGKRHPYTVSFPGAMAQPCAIASSTDFRRQVVPFLARYSGMNSNEVYENVRRTM